MKSKFKKGITTVLATTTLFVSIFQAAVSVRADMNDIQNFVRSLYVDCLGRQPDQIGFDYWCSRLQSGEITGKQCASAEWSVLPAGEEMHVAIGVPDQVM